MTPNAFIEHYGARVTLAAFNEASFSARSDLDILQDSKPISSFSDMFTPWYRTRDHLIEFQNALHGGDSKAIKVSEAEYIDKNDERRRTIEKYRGNATNKKPILIFTSMDTNKSLIVDGNKTAVAMYRNYLKNQIDQCICVVEVKGISIEAFLGDFYIVNREDNEQK